MDVRHSHTPRIKESITIRHTLQLWFLMQLAVAQLWLCITIPTEFPFVPIFGN